MKLVSGFFNNNLPLVFFGVQYLALCMKRGILFILIINISKSSVSYIISCKVFFLGRSGKKSSFTIKTSAFVMNIIESVNGTALALTSMAESVVYKKCILNITHVICVRVCTCSLTLKKFVYRFQVIQSYIRFLFPHQTCSLILELRDKLPCPS